MQKKIILQLSLIMGAANMSYHDLTAATLLCGKAYTERAQLNGQVVYPERFKVAEDKRDWNIADPDYDPPYYLDNHVKQNVHHAEINPKGWAQSEDFTKTFFIDAPTSDNNSNPLPSSEKQLIYRKGRYVTTSDAQAQKKIKTICPSLCKSHDREWDNKINPAQEGRYSCGCLITAKFNSHLGSENIQKSDKNLPLNPCGRTGIAGRGLLGNWGPNHAADPIITRYNPSTGNLEVLLIKRDNNEWAIPGGMVDASDPNISAAAARELQEETGTKISMADAKEIYRGTVRDPRNTDNAWMETVALHKHLDNKLSLLADKNLKAHDATEIKKIRWVKWDDPRMNNLYASHTEFIQKALNSMTKHIEPFAPAA